MCSEEEDPTDDYPFPLNLRGAKKVNGGTSPVDGVLDGGVIGS